MVVGPLWLPPLLCLWPVSQSQAVATPGAQPTSPATLGAPGASGVARYTCAQPWTVKFHASWLGLLNEHFMAAHSAVLPCCERWDVMVEEGYRTVFMNDPGTTDERILVTSVLAGFHDGPGRQLLNNAAFVADAKTVDLPLFDILEGQRARATIAQEARTVRLWPDVDAPGMVAALAAPGDPGVSHTTQTRGGA